MTRRAAREPDFTRDRETGAWGTGFLGVMRLRRGRTRRLAALAGLAAILIWVAAGALHEHPGDPGCQVCKLLHHGAADVIRPVQWRATRPVGQAVTPPSTSPSLGFAPSTPPGRAPPLA